LINARAAWKSLEILSSLPFGWMVTHFGISAKSSGSVQTPKTDPCHGKISISRHQKIVGPANFLVVSLNELFSFRFTGY
jgi:hypothetical protein